APAKCDAKSDCGDCDDAKTCDATAACDAPAECDAPAACDAPAKCDAKSDCGDCDDAKACDATAACDAPAECDAPATCDAPAKCDAKSDCSDCGTKACGAPASCDAAAKCDAPAECGAAAKCDAKSDCGDCGAKACDGTADCTTALAPLLPAAADLLLWEPTQDLAGTLLPAPAPGIEVVAFAPALPASPVLIAEPIDRFGSTPIVVPAKAAWKIQYTNEDLAGESVELVVTCLDAPEKGEPDSLEATFSVELNKKGKGKLKAQLPAGWRLMRLDGPGAKPLFAVRL
ncbi:MAG: hypothetical protein P1V81_16265, partial [Planctomycetota bacterium]|nr:hypothetical protein [Planctomycetota bacterium]